MNDFATVEPGEGGLSDLARTLLALADHPRDVRTAGNGTTFEVPVELADRYLELLHGTPEKPEPKRRGRPPRMNTED